MAIKMTDTKYYQDIADAIRAKNGSSDTYIPADMPQAIEDIPTGADTLAQASTGTLSGEVTIDYGTIQNANPSVIIGVDTASRINAGITKLSFVCVDGAKETYSPLRVSGLSNVNPWPLEEVDFGNLQETYMDTMENGSSPSFTALTKITAPKLKARVERWRYFFCGAAVLEELKLPSIVQLYGSCFKYCPMLKTVDLGRSDLSAIGYSATLANAFGNCTSLTALIMRSPFMYNLSTALTNTPIAAGTGYIYVPRALISTYQAATNWTTYAAQFRAIEDYTDDGTIDGEFVPPAN